jgi:hypothetical protein
MKLFNDFVPDQDFRYLLSSTVVISVFRSYEFAKQMVCVQLIFNFYSGYVSRED